MVGQTILFDDTVKNNIKYAKDATDEIFRLLNYHFVRNLLKIFDKFETLIGENGVRLSGGEKQRLSIARAMLKKAQSFYLMRQLHH